MDREGLASAATACVQKDIAKFEEAQRQQQELDAARQNLNELVIKREGMFDFLVGIALGSTDLNDSTNSLAICIGELPVKPAPDREEELRTVYATVRPDPKSARRVSQHREADDGSGITEQSLVEVVEVQFWVGKEDSDDERGILPDPTRIGIVTTPFGPSKECYGQQLDIDERYELYGLPVPAESDPSRMHRVGLSPGASYSKEDIEQRIESINTQLPIMASTVGLITGGMRDSNNPRNRY